MSVLPIISTYRAYHIDLSKLSSFNIGISVPSVDLKTVKKGKGLMYTDYVIGNGVVPKLGQTVKVVYVGYFPTGKVFDACIKRSIPFVFRKGVNQVVKVLCSPTVHYEVDSCFKSGMSMFLCVMFSDCFLMDGWKDGWMDGWID